MSSAFRRSGTGKVSIPQTGGTPASSTAASRSDQSPSSTSKSSLAPALLETIPNKGTSSTRMTMTMMTPPPMKGVKPWHGGSYLTSVGLNDLDTILGGGQPLGTCILLEEDRWMVDLAHSLIKYWCAEAISQDQHLIVPLLEEEEEKLVQNNRLDNSIADDTSGGGLQSTELEDLILNLPKNLHWEKYRKKKQQDHEVVGGVNAMDGSLDVLAEGDDEDDDEKDDNVHDEDDDEGLVVAWQYKMSVQKERLATTATMTPHSMSSTNSGNNHRTVFCHSYDLSGRIIDQTTIDPSKHVVALPPSSILPSHPIQSKTALGMDLFFNLVQLLKNQTVTSQQQQGKAIRLLLYHPTLEVMAVALPLLLSHIRKESLPVVIMICTRPSSEEVRSWIQLSRSSDIVLRTEGFASRKHYPPPPEFKHLQGVLKVDKTTKKPTEIAASIYGFKRDRRKLHIPLLHIPPEDYAEGGGSVGAGGLRSGAGRRPTSSTGGEDGTKGTTSRSFSTKKTTSGMGCSTNISGSVLDF